MTTALIDGDIVAYQVATMSAHPTTWEGEGAETFDEADVRMSIDKMVTAWMDKADCTERVVLLTGPSNFRKVVDPTYKSNRKDKPKPVALGFARQVLLDSYGARVVDGLEADDLIGLMLTGSMADGKGVAVTLDKDLLTVPGLHCNPVKGGIRNVNDEYADRMWMTQTLTGDAVDGYSGARKVGPVKALQALQGKGHLQAMWVAVQQTYAKAGQTVADALRNARLARILRAGDYSKETREVLLWTPQGDPERLALAGAAA